MNKTCWRKMDEVISYVLLWTSTHGCASVSHPARTYIQHLCADTSCSFEDLPGAMDNRDRRIESQGNPCLQHKLMMMSLNWIYSFYLTLNIWILTVFSLELFFFLFHLLNLFFLRIFFVFLLNFFFFFLIITV